MESLSMPANLLKGSFSEQASLAMHLLSRLWEKLRHTYVEERLVWSRLI